MSNSDWQIRHIYLFCISCDSLAFHQLANKGCSRVRYSKDVVQGVWRGRLHPGMDAHLTGFCSSNKQISAGRLAWLISASLIIHVNVSSTIPPREHDPSDNDHCEMCDHCNRADQTQGRLEFVDPSVITSCRSIMACRCSSLEANNRGVRQLSWLMKTLNALF
jgi:hypothetical protein